MRLFSGFAEYYYILFMQSLLPLRFHSQPYFTHFHSSSLSGVSGLALERVFMVSGIVTVA